MTRSSSRKLKRRRLPTPGSWPQDLAITWRSIDDVTPYPNNPRVNEHAVAKVARSIAQFGWRQPIVVDEQGVVLAGHTRLEAARSLRMTAVPVHVAAGLTPSQARAYRLADNRVAEEANWDQEKLVAELAALEQDPLLLTSTGFDDGELDALLGEPVEDGEARGAAAPQLLCMVECEDETQLQQLFEELSARGFACKLVT